MIKNNEYQNGGPYPETILREIFDKCLTGLRNGMSEMNLKPTHMLIRFESKLLMKTVGLWLHRFDKDVVDAIFVEFKKFDQSGEDKGIASLTTQKFTVDIQAFEALQIDDNGRVKSKHSGKGGRVNRKFWHDINEDRALIKVENDDNCGFSQFYIL